MNTILLNGNITAGLRKAKFIQIPSAFTLVTHTDSTHSGINMPEELSFLQGVSFLLFQTTRSREFSKQQCFGEAY